MKKRYKGYFKRPTNALDPFEREYIRMKRSYSTNNRFRIGLWVNLYIKYEMNGRK